MGLSADIESKIRAAVAANESADYGLAATLLRSAIMLMAGHPRIKFEDSETEYTRDDLVALQKEMQTLATQQARASQTSGGFVGIPIRHRTS